METLRTAYDESAYYLSFLKETAIHTIYLSWSRQLFIHQPRLDSGTLHILYLKSFPIKRGSQISSFLEKFSSRSSFLFSELPLFCILQVASGLRSR